MTRKPFAIVSLLLSVACTTEKTESACDGAEGAACFADASEAELVAAANAGVGITFLVPYLMATLAETDALYDVGETCPTMTVDGDVMTLTADGCTGAVSGVTWSGTVTWTNPPVPTVVSEEDNEVEWTVESDPGAPSEILFDGFQMDSVENGIARTRVADGRFWMGSTDGETVEEEVDLSLAVDGGPVSRLIATYDCDTDGLCVDAVPPTGEVEDLGSFDITVATDDAGAVSSITLTGADVLSIAPADAETGCTSLDGRADYCVGEAFPDIDPVEIDDQTEDAAFYGAGLGMESGTEGDFFDFHADTVGEPGSVEVWAYDTNNEALGTEGHTLVAAGDGYWEARVEAGTDYEDGVGSTFPIDDLSALVMEYRLYDADGELVSCRFYSKGVDDPQSWFDSSACPRID